MTAVSRRDVLAGAAAAGALAATTGLRFMPASVFLYDARLDATGLACAAAARSGSRIVPIANDVGRLAHQLDSVLLWRSTAVAGLTSPASRFIFEQLALRRGVCVLRHSTNSWSTPAGRSVGLDVLRALQTADLGLNNG